MVQVNEATVRRNIAYLGIVISFRIGNPGNICDLVCTEPNASGFDLSPHVGYPDGN